MARPNKILVAFDGSPHSKKALEWAIDLNHYTHGSVVVVHVSEPVHLTSLYGTDGSNARLLAEAIKEVEAEDRKTLEEAKIYCENRAVNVKTELLYGNIAETIIKYAQDERMDLIIAGTKGHGKLEELLMGSVTRNLVSLSHIPVLVVKD